jgi:hypothetical protein
MLNIECYLQHFVSIPSLQAWAALLFHP